jgi:hypothetical protein
MTRQQLLDKQDYFNLVHGITLRAIETFADDDLDFRPEPGMRTPRELIFHVYGQSAEAARDGSFTTELANRANPEDASTTAAVRALATVADLVAYARACHAAAEVALGLAMTPDCDIQEGLRRYECRPIAADTTSRSVGAADRTGDDDTKWTRSSTQDRHAALLAGTNRRRWLVPASRTPRSTPGTTVAGRPPDTPITLTSADTIMTRLVCWADYP